MNILFKLLLAVIFVLIISYAVAYLYHFGKVKVIGKDRSVYKFLNGKQDKLYYFPNLKYGISGEISTIQALKKNKTKYRPRREFLQSSDGGEFAIDWFEPQNGAVIPDDAPIVIFQHGLSGGSSEPCIQKFALRCVNELGWRSCCFILRGCCGLRIKTLKSYHGTATYDFHDSLKHVSELYPKAPIAVLGYSLGGNMVAQYFGERESKYQGFRHYEYYERGEEMPKNVVCGGAVCCPFDFLTIDKHLPLRYSLIAGGGMWHYVNNNKHLIGETEMWKNLPKDFQATARNVDNAFTIHFFNFKDTDEFYKETSCIHTLNGIRLPFLFISTMNDCASLSIAFPWKVLEEECTDNVGAMMLKAGGHNGMFGVIDTKWTFDEEMMIKFFKYHFGLFNGINGKEERNNEEDKNKDKQE